MPIDYAEHLRHNGGLFSLAAAKDLEAHVPSCPEWNVAKLTIHMGQHHRWVAEAIRGRGEAPSDPPKPGLRGEELIAWSREGWRELADLIDETPDDQAAWTWSADQHARFWKRRTALETLVHRWDAENATGTTSPMDPELAADCVDEVFSVMLPDSGEPYSGASGALAVVLDDFHRSWTLRLEPGAFPTVDVGAEGADTTIRATAEDMCLFLWGRKQQDVLTVEGDNVLLQDFRAWSE
jgi:uncharacterized protein (TIGR03083 family)